MKKPEYKIAEEVALEELVGLVEYHSALDADPDEVRERYPHALKALRMGLLVIDEDKNPTYTLSEPVSNVEGSSVAVETITFKTRITTREYQNLSKGFDARKDATLINQKTFGFVIGQPVNMLDKFGKLDYKAIEQVASLFL